MTFRDDLDALIPREPQNICPVCSLYKTLPADEASLLFEAVDIVQVSVSKIQAALRKNNVVIADKRIYTHRQQCTVDFLEPPA